MRITDSTGAIKQKKRKKPLEKTREYKQTPNLGPLFLFQHQICSQVPHVTT